MAIKNGRLYLSEKDKKTVEQIGEYCRTQYLASIDALFKMNTASKIEMWAGIIVLCLLGLLAWIG